MLISYMSKVLWTTWVVFALVFELFNISCGILKVAGKTHSFENRRKSILPLSTSYSVI